MTEQRLRRLPTARLRSSSPRAWFAALLVVLLSGCADAQLAEVIAVADGDSIVAMVDGARARIRLAEIDAPERGQPWNARARAALSDKVLKKRVRLVVVDEDQYGRLVAHVWLGDRHINRELVREGNAWVYTRYSSDETLLAEQAQAREQRLGLWSMSDQTEPWRWRQAKRASASATR